jgi:small subunit ribosomal protein S9
LSETPEEPERTTEEDEATGAGAGETVDESAGAPDAESAGADAPASEGDEQAARADSSPDAPTEETADAPAEEAPAASEDPVAEQPPAEAIPSETSQPEAAAAPAQPEAAAAPAQPAAAEAPAQPAAPEAPEAPAQPTGESDEAELAPRAKPEIPGADLIPDVAPEDEQYLDAEARAAAEAEAEAAAERARAEAEDEQARPIADAAIDLAAGARYTATGKRKTAVARVILKPGNGDYVINGKTLAAFFPRDTLQRMIRQPLETVGYEARMDVVARMHGGGVAAQAGALRHGISRALIVADPNLRGELKRRGYLTRDPRVKERKKAGLKKARKRPQFSKR